VKWYRKAAEQGFAIAQFDLGVMYDTGRGVATLMTPAQIAEAQRMAREWKPKKK